MTSVSFQLTRKVGDMPRLNLNGSSNQNDKGRGKDKTGATPEGAVREKTSPALNEKKERRLCMAILDC